MLKSLRNHRQSQPESQRPNGKKWRIVGGRCWEKIAFMAIKIDCNCVCTSKQVGLEVNTIIEDVRGWRNSKRIELLSSDDPTPSPGHPVRRLGERCLASVTRACGIPSVVGSVNTGAVVIHGKYRSSEVNKSIVISIINRNVYRWATAKRWFSQHDQKRRPIRSVASDCLTKIYERSH